MEVVSAFIYNQFGVITLIHTILLPKIPRVKGPILGKFTETKFSSNNVPIACQ